MRKEVVRAVHVHAESNLTPHSKMITSIQCWVSVSTMSRSFSGLLLALCRICSVQQRVDIKQQRAHRRQLSMFRCASMSYAEIAAHLLPDVEEAAAAMR